LLEWKLDINWDNSSSEVETSLDYSQSHKTEADNAPPLIEGVRLVLDGLDFRLAKLAERVINPW
jgi:hypothetical protein